MNLMQLPDAKRQHWWRSWDRTKTELESDLCFFLLFTFQVFDLQDLPSHSSSLSPSRARRRGERTTGHMLREGRVEVEEICLLVTSEWSSGMKISFPGLIVVPLSTPERTVSRLMVYERKRKGWPLMISTTFPFQRSILSFLFSFRLGF